MSLLFCGALLGSAATCGTRPMRGELGWVRGDTSTQMKITRTHMGGSLKCRGVHIIEGPTGWVKTEKMPPETNLLFCNKKPSSKLRHRQYKLHHEDYFQQNNKVHPFWSIFPVFWFTSGSETRPLDWYIGGIDFFSAQQWWEDVS